MAKDQKRPRSKKREIQRDELKREWRRNRDAHAVTAPPDVTQMTRRLLAMLSEKDDVRLKIEAWQGKGVSVSEVVEFLDLLAGLLITDDDSHSNAETIAAASGVIKSLDLAGGGKSVLLELADQLSPRPVAVLAEMMVPVIEKHRCSAREAAERIVAQFGIQGQSFESVVDELRRYYASRVRP